MITFEQATQLREHKEEFEAIVDKIDDITYALNRHATTTDELRQVDALYNAVTAINTSITTIAALLQQDAQQSN